MDWKSWQLQFSKSVKLKTDSIWVKNKSVNIYQHIIYSSPTMSKKVIIGESFPESFGSFQLCFSQLASWLDFTLDFTQLQTWKLHEKKSPHQSMTGRPSNNTLARHWASLIRDSKNSTIRSMDCPNDKGLSESHGKNRTKTPKFRVIFPEFTISNGRNTFGTPFLETP